MKNVRSLIDLVPKSGVVQVQSLPKGKPTHRVVCTNGGFKQITYIFKNEVYLRNIYRGQEQIFKKRPEIVNSKGDFLR